MKRLLLLSIALLFAFNLRAQVKEDKLRKDTINSITNSISYDRLYSIVIENLKKLEGLRLKSYNGVGGRTIGYGHQIGENFTKSEITIEQADSILKNDYDNAINFVRKETGFNEHNFPEKLLALASFAFNVGEGMFLKSRLLLYVKGNKLLEEIKAEFERWVKANGKENKNLKRMRDFEFNLYSGKIK